MEASCTQVDQNDQLRLNLSHFEDEVKSFCNNEALESKLGKQAQEIREWAGEKTSENDLQVVTEVGKVIETSITSLDDFKSGEPSRIIKGCLSIAQSVSNMIGGPYGAAASAICGILGAILSQSSPTKPDMATLLIEEVGKKIEKEFGKFNRALQEQEYSGLDTRMRSMVECMKSILIKKVSKDEPIPDRILFDTHLPHFTGKVAANFTNCGKLTNEEACKNCVDSLVLYCKAQTAHITLLTIIISAFKCSGREIKLSESHLESAKAESKRKLAFLSDERQMRKKSHQSKSQTMLAIYVLRNNLAYRVIEGFRESLGMKKMPSLKEIGRIALEAHHCYPEDATHRYERPHAKGDYHYFQLINHTEFPIQVKCGDGVGNKVNLLDFTQMVEPYHSYEHRATTRFNRTFSTGGVFAVYLDNQMRSEENMLENDGSRMKVFEFALSKPIVGKNKSAIFETTNDFSPATNGETCWNAMINGTASESPIYFEVDCLSYIAFTAYSTRGKNRCQTCRFVVQNYNPHQMHLISHERQSFYQKRENVNFEQLNIVERAPRQQSRVREDRVEIISPLNSDRISNTTTSSRSETDDPCTPSSSHVSGANTNKIITIVMRTSKKTNGKDVKESSGNTNSERSRSDTNGPCSPPTNPSTTKISPLDKTDGNNERFPFSNIKKLVCFSLFAVFILMLFVLAKYVCFYEVPSIISFH